MTESHSGKECLVIGTIMVVSCHLFLVFFIRYWYYHCFHSLDAGTIMVVYFLMLFTSTNGTLMVVLFP